MYLHKHTHTKYKLVYIYITMCTVTAKQLCIHIKFVPCNFPNNNRYNILRNFEILTSKLPAQTSAQLSN